MNRKKYLLWFAGVVVWILVYCAKPIMDIIEALFLRHIIGLDKILLVSVILTTHYIYMAIFVNY